MKAETQQALAELKKLEMVLGAYNHVLGVTYLDASTAAPKMTYAGRGQALGVMSQITYDLEADPKNDRMLKILEADRDSLDAQTRREVEVARKNYDEIARMPAEDVVAYSMLLNDAQAVWEKAKNENDFASFAPYLQKIVDFNRKFAGFFNPNMKPYDALLDK